jgi:hypothetical protein
MQAVFDVAFKVEVKVPLPADAVVGAAGMKQLVWQFAACELHDIMQFVTVEVTGVESPWKGGVTFGVVACASATSCAPKQIAAATTRIGRTHNDASVIFSDHHSGMCVRRERREPGEGHRPYRLRPQSSSGSRVTAGAAGFLTFSQQTARPERYGDPSRFETMPSQPSAQA